MQLKKVKLSLGGKEILKGLDIDFWEGHIHAVVGSNGAGKSTLSYTLMGLSGYQDFEGDIIFDGKSMKGMDVHERAKLGITLGWQEPARFEGLSVEKFIRASRKDITKEEIEKLLDRVGLRCEEYINRAVDKTLSGGERKKIELASILAMKPKFVMLDEPDSGIDVASLEAIFEGLKYLKENGATIVLITHSLAVLEQAEHAFLMCGGKVIDKGPIDKIKPYFEQRCIPCDHPNIRGLDEVSQ